MYITFEEYSALYDPIDEKLFNRLAFDSCCVMDMHTTGIDNVKKLKRFFPTEEDDAQAVKHCAAKLINTLYQIHKAEESAAGAYENSEMGIRGKYIQSITAGNESISYTSGDTSKTAIDSAVADKTQQNKLLADVVWDYLRGVRDANGINLLFMGSYPRGYLYAD